MSISKTISNILTIALISSRLDAAEPAPVRASNEAIQQQLLEMQKGIQEMQSRHQTELEALKKQLADQQVVIDTLKQNPPGSPASPVQTEGKPVAGDPSPAFPTTDPMLMPDPVGVLLSNNPPANNPAPSGNVFPTTDSSVVTDGPVAGLVPGLPASSGPSGGGGAKGSYLNISFDAVFTGAASTDPNLGSLEVGDHDPQQRGFNARNIELALDGAVDPYFEGFANIVFKLDSNNETSVEAEEVFGQTTSLPYGLQAKGGQFFSPFGRLNPTHPHTWDFADAPLVNGLMLGPDGLRGVGAQIAWVIPVPFYAQALVAVQNGEGGTAYSFRNPGEDGTFYGRQTIDRQTDGLSDMAIAPHLEASFDLSPTQTILGGVSAAFGPNDTGENDRTQIYGVDLFYKWKPANAEGGWPFVKWQSEAMFRRYEAGHGLDDSFPVAETFHDWGAYSQVVWGFHKGWAAGLRGDYVHMESSDITDDPQRQSRYRLSTDLTWYPSEFSKLRLQYNHDMLKSTDFEPNRDEDSVFLMYEFSLGAHGAHKY
jgi:hypothetical protein